MGLGHGTNADQAYSSELRRTKILPLINHKDCEATLTDKHFQPKHSITWTAHSSHLCAGGDEDSDTCEGDGGGPLVCAATAETSEPEVAPVVAGEGGAGPVVSDPDPIFGDFENEYDTDQGDIDEGDEVFGDLGLEDEPDVNIFEEYNDEACDDTEGEDALGLRTSPLCKKRARDSPKESGTIKRRLWSLV